MTSHGECYTPMTTSDNHASAAPCFDAAAGSRYAAAAHCACATDDRLPLNFSHHDQRYYDALPQQQQLQQQQLGWFAVRNMLIPLNVGASTTATGYRDSRQNNDQPGITHVCIVEVGLVNHS